MPFLSAILNVICVWLQFSKKKVFSLRAAIFAFLMARFSKTFNRVMADHKRKLFAPLTELAAKLDRPLKIVEIGPGSGANFAFYPPGSEVLCVDPNKYFEQYLQKSAAKYPHLNCKFCLGRAEDLSNIADNSVDAVVGTLVLCSVRDIGSCMNEIKRILKKVCFDLLYHSS